MPSGSELNILAQGPQLLNGRSCANGNENERSELLHEFPVPGHPLLDCTARWWHRDDIERIDDLHDRAVDVLAEGEKHVSFRGEVGVEARLRDPRPVCDLLDSSAKVPLLQEEVLGGADDQRGGGLRARAQGGRWLTRGRRHYRHGGGGPADEDRRA